MEPDYVITILIILMIVLYRISLFVSDGMKVDD